MQQGITAEGDDNTHGLARISRRDRHCLLTRRQLIILHAFLFLDSLPLHTADR